jgi:hypothetical protein
MCLKKLSFSHSSFASASLSHLFGKKTARGGKIYLHPLLGNFRTFEHLFIPFMTQTKRENESERKEKHVGWSHMVIDC